MDLIESLKSIGGFIYRFKFLLAFVTIFTLGLISYLYFSPDSIKNLGASVNDAESVDIGHFPIVKPTMKYGFALDTFQVYEGKIKTGDYFGAILNRYNIDHIKITRLAEASKPVFNINTFRQDKPYTILAKDSTQKADYFIYEPDVYSYIVFDLDSLKASEVERPISYTTRTGKVTVESSLWKAIVDNDMSYAIADKMEDALQWTLDFYRIQKGDEFKLLYDEESIRGEVVGVDMVKAATYKSEGKTYYSIYFDNGKLSGYFDEYGRPMANGFLKSPVKASRISSYYNLNRFHPILKRRRPHYGTDYAAPYGTPIMAVGNGVVTKASYSKGNGNYVKIKHDNTYQTQYLHMQKFAKDIRPGTPVKQGQTIGYVGSTGLATGPHVCFRFWKNNKQVNHLRMSFPPPEPLPKESLEAFFKVRDEYLKLLDEPIPAKLEDEKKATQS